MAPRMMMRRQQYFNTWPPALAAILGLMSSSIAHPNFIPKLLVMGLSMCGPVPKFISEGFL
eukprot:15331898-Ditylum_brightwellii.AAC.1